MFSKLLNYYEIFNFCNFSRMKHYFKCFKSVQVLRKSYDFKLQSTTTFQTVTIKLVRISTVTFNKKTSFNMKPKTRRRLILLLTFMLARHNVIASISCMSGCQHKDHSSCDPSSTVCSEGEICSRFQIYAAYTKAGG